MVSGVMRKQIYVHAISDNFGLCPAVIYKDKIHTHLVWKNFFTLAQGLCIYSLLSPLLLIVSNYSLVLQLYRPINKISVFRVTNLR